MADQGPESFQCLAVARDPVVIEVPLNHRSQPSGLLRYRPVPVSHQDLAYALDLLAQALADGLAPHCEASDRKSVV